ncbi:serine/threonine protein kinase [Actinomadura barringtoniae]|uniref:non-specific serine/threonine protein kinase n=1 Tax=Actinomadura barringtoniae TaxID=1427535 RepID=A0A939PDF5_9ACTN|nr:serine/threonine-protein kinase [Actinomadura barringtoniae]MBO2450575.1 serine/threonine protein kinase [Actinomadura barringtoniae]
MGQWQVPGYTELRVLGEGAQGRVVLARHDASGRPAAIKYLSERLCEDETFRERFRDEADLLRRVQNPYIARLFGLVEVPEGAAIVMEAVDGVPLKAVLAEQGTLAPEASLAVLKGSLLGLAAAHGAGVVHRDYKPANVIVRPDGLSKLIDFGIAVDAGEAGRSGTPVYMAPEQWRDEPASPATDVYAATCVFYECVTGRRPFTADDQVALMGKHLTGPIPVEEVPAALRPIIERGMAKDAWGRPPGAAAFVNELEQAATAAYGSDWEQSGVRALAGAAVALAALFPLTALGLAPAGAGAAGTAGAAGAAGASGATGASSATSTGVLGALGAKGAAGIAAAVVVGAVGVGGAVYYASADDKPKPKPTPTAAAQPMSFDLKPLAAQSQTVTGGGRWQARGQVVTVSGGPNPAVGQKIDQALRAPLDAYFVAARRILGSQSSGTYTTTVKPVIRLRGPKLISVMYDTDMLGQVGTGWGQSRGVTVNLTTGAAYGAADLFQAPVTARLAAFNKAVLNHLPGKRWCREEPDHGGITTKELNSGDAAIALGRTDLQLKIVTAAMGYLGACGGVAAKVPYSEIKDLLKPEILAAIPYP